MWSHPEDAESAADDSCGPDDAELMYLNFKHDVLELSYCSRQKTASMSQYPDETDLTTPQGVAVYLALTPFACTKAEPLSGGLVNFVFRLHLITPYQGRSTLILKHASPYAANIPEFSIPVSRQVRKEVQSDIGFLHHLPALPLQLNQLTCRTTHSFLRISKWTPCVGYAHIFRPTRPSPSQRCTTLTALTTRS